MSEAMLAFGLRRVIAAHSRVKLARWLAEARAEAGLGAADRRPVLCGPEVVAQILAGNVAGLAIPAALEALLARSAVLLKPAAEERTTARLFKESLDRAAPALGRAVAVAQWTGGDEAIERDVFAAADLVVASGGDVDGAFAGGARAGTRLLVHGPRISIGLVGGGWREAPDSWWSRVAREIVLWEQAGCLSPRILFVAGDRRRFADRLAKALAGWERRWPVAAAHCCSGLGDPCASRSLRDGGWACVAASSLPPAPTWSVAWDDALSLDAGPPARAVRVTALPNPQELRSCLRRTATRCRGWATLAWARASERSRMLPGRPGLRTLHRSRPSRILPRDGGRMGVRAWPSCCGAVAGSRRRLSSSSRNHRSDHPHGELIFKRLRELGARLRRASRVDFVEPHRHRGGPRRGTLHPHARRPSLPGLVGRDRGGQRRPHAPGSSRGGGAAEPALSPRHGLWRVRAGGAGALRRRTRRGPARADRPCLLREQRRRGGRRRAQARPQGHRAGRVRRLYRGLSRRHVRSAKRCRKCGLSGSLQATSGARAAVAVRGRRSAGCAGRERGRGHRGAGPGRGRRAHPPRRFPPRVGPALPRGGGAPHLRRGHDRVRSDRAAVRVRALGCGPRRDRAREGAGGRLSVGGVRRIERAACRP